MNWKQLCSLGPRKKFFEWEKLIIIVLFALWFLRLLCKFMALFCGSNCGTFSQEGWCLLMLLDVSTLIIHNELLHRDVVCFKLIILICYQLFENRKHNNVMNLKQLRDNKSSFRWKTTQPSRSMIFSRTIHKLRPRNLTQNVNALTLRAVPTAGQIFRSIELLTSDKSPL